MVNPAVPDRAPAAKPTERMQRVRVGVTGLAAILLVVVVATAVASGLRQSAEPSNATVAAPAAVTAVVAPNSADPDSEPLAQLGAAPGPTTESSASAAPKK